MKITADTNVLVRAVVGDDPAQAKVAATVLLDATLIAIAPMDAANAIRALFAAANVQMNRPAVEACLLVLVAGGNFADGVIAYEGHWLGRETFVSFDKKAVALLKAQRQLVRLLRCWATSNRGVEFKRVDALHLHQKHAHYHARPQDGRGVCIAL